MYFSDSELLFGNITNGSTSSPTEEVYNPIDKLFHAVFQCFLLIFFGYIAGRASLLSDAGAKGLNHYVGTFALPALLFKSMATLDLKELNWSFLGIVFMSKSIVFVAVVIVVGVLFYNRDNGVGCSENLGVPLGICGLAAIFATQSNDFAFGLPIIQVIYSEMHPNYASYLYIVAPVSLCVLNPLGIVMLEMQRRKRDWNGDGTSLAGVVWRILRGAFGNPIVFVTLIGLVVNLIQLGVGKYVTIFDDIFKMLADSFGATALFSLGFNMVGKIRKSFSFGMLFLPCIMIIAKLIIMPLVIEQTTNLFSPNDTDLATFGFLYGTFPTAPTVFIIASQYGVEVDQMAVGMVFCTFLAAPLMSFTAMLLDLKCRTSACGINDSLAKAGEVLASISMVFCVWTLARFFYKRRWISPSHVITMMLCVSIVITSVAVIVERHVDQDDDIGLVAQFSVMFGSVVMTRMLAALLGVVIAIVNIVSMKSLKRIIVVSIIGALGFAIALAALVVVLGEKREKADSSSRAGDTLVFQFGLAQAVGSLFFLLVALVALLVAAVFIFRNHFTYDGESQTPTVAVPTGTNQTPITLQKEENHELVSPAPKVSRRGVRSSNFVCVSDVCISLEIKRHLGLLFVMLISMLVGLFLCIWRTHIYLSSSDQMLKSFTPDFYVVEFVDYVFSLALGFFVFLFFGFDELVSAAAFLVRKVREIVGRQFSYNLTRSSAESVSVIEVNVPPNM